MLGNKEIKLTQFVHDLSLNQTSKVQTNIFYLETFHKMAGLKVNNDTTEGM